MAQVSFANRQVSCKIVYYGPALSGKTTNIEIVHQKVPDNHRGELTSIATEGDRTLFFDFMPLDLGNVAGMNTKFQLYTVPGQVYYNATRKLVLRGADGIVFVADSSPDRFEATIESLENLKENLAEQGVDISKIPLVIQYNKRDVPGAVEISLLQSRLNPRLIPHFEAIASTGQGVMQTLKTLSKLVLDQLNRQYGARSIAGSAVSVQMKEVSLNAKNTSSAGTGKAPSRVDSETEKTIQAVSAVSAATRPTRPAQPRPVRRAAPVKPAASRISPPRSNKKIVRQVRNVSEIQEPTERHIGRALLLLFLIFLLSGGLAVLTWSLF